MATGDLPITEVQVSAFTIPLERPEADGTLAWDSTTAIVVEARSGQRTGLGYTFGSPAVARFARELCAPAVDGLSAWDTAIAWQAMNAASRNAGRPGVGMMAIAAVDTALWDLKARATERSLVDLLGRARHDIAAYGSGGFTSLDTRELVDQLASWADEGFHAVKMKVGRGIDDDATRAVAARKAIGDAVDLYADANGAYWPREATVCAAAMADAGVTWFEEPVTSDDRDGLRFVREHSPPPIRIAAGEYAATADDFRLLASDGCIDVLQADATRCGGPDGFLLAAHLAEAFHLPLSAHTAPSLHTTLCCAVPSACNVEWFADHVRAEALLFDGAVKAEGGRLRPNDAPGLGMELRRPDVERFEVRVQ